MLILMAARQAIEAAMARRRSSSEALRSSRSAISRISKITFSTSPAPTAAGADFTAMVRFPKGSVSKPSECSSSAMRA